MNASSETAPTIGGTKLTNGKDTETEALDAVTNATKGSKVEAAKDATMTSSTVKNENGETITVYKVIAENKTIKFYAVKFTETPVEPSDPVVPPVSEVVGPGTTVQDTESIEAELNGESNGFTLPQGQEIGENNEVTIVAAKKYTADADKFGKEGKLEFTETTEDEQLIGVKVDSTKANVAITPVEDAGAGKLAVNETKTWKITITLKEGVEVAQGGLEITIVTATTVEKVALADKLNVVAANLTIADGQDAPAYGHATEYKVTLDKTKKEITVTATGLKKTTNDANPQVTEYWVGVGVTKLDGATYAWNFGAFDEKTAEYKEMKRTQTVEGVDYNTFYWSTSGDEGDTWATEGKTTGYLSVKVGDEVVTYTVKFAVNVATENNPAVSEGSENVEA